jgi:hypothetical protein
MVDGRPFYIRIMVESLTGFDAPQTQRLERFIMLKPKMIGFHQRRDLSLIDGKRVRNAG